MVADKPTAGPRSHQGKRHFRGKEPRLPAQALREKTHISWGKLDSPPAANPPRDRLLWRVLSARVSDNPRRCCRGQSRLGAKGEQREHSPAVLRGAPHPPCAHLQLPAALSATATVPTEPESPVLQPCPAQAPTSQPLGHHLCHLVGTVPAPHGLGHPRVPAPLDPGACKSGRNVLVVSTTLPANKRSKLGGAEPAGGIWQLTCHFVRHWSKLISLAESP